MSRNMPALPWLWTLPALWIGVMFTTYTLFHSGGRTSVMEARLVLGALLCATLWWGLRQTSQPATQLMGWLITREAWPITAMVLGFGLVTLWPLLQQGNLATLLQPALIEETLFRGFAFGVLAAVAGSARALCWSAVMFGVLHIFEGLGTALGAAVAGLLLLGTARLATGNVVAPLVMHAVMNAGQTNAALLIWVAAVLGSGLARARRIPPPQTTPRDSFLQQGERLKRRLGHAWLAWPTAFEWQLWTLSSPVEEEGEALTDPAQSALLGPLMALIVLIMLEELAVHFIVRSLGDSHLTLISAAGLYTVFWLAAFRRQIQRRPTMLSPDRLLVRTGLLWTTDIPRSHVATAERVTATPTGPARHLSPLEKANVRLSLHTPIVCRSLWGWAVPAQVLTFRVQAPEQVIAWANKGLPDA